MRAPREPWNLDLAEVLLRSISGDEPHPALVNAFEQIAERVCRRMMLTGARPERLSAAEACRRMELSERTWWRRVKHPALAACKGDDGKWAWPELDQAHQKIFG
jgi:DNA-directed RNA polymerase subunit N (RpoN/RPB10)